jgi:hypothetical protein
MNSLDDTNKNEVDMPKEQKSGDSMNRTSPRFSEDTLNLFRMIIGLALLVPAIQLYFTIPSIVSMWVADQYVPLVNMVYFLAIIIGGIWLIRYTFTLSTVEKKK